jgi:uncharacterized protein (DUF362 family)
MHACRKHTVLEADFLVSMPKVKAHWSGVTLCMKNMFGIVPEIRYGGRRTFFTGHAFNKAFLIFVQRFRTTS